MSGTDSDIHEHLSLSVHAQPSYSFFWVLQKPYNASEFADARGLREFFGKFRSSQKNIMFPTCFVNFDVFSYYYCKITSSVTMLLLDGDVTGLSGGESSATVPHLLKMLDEIRPKCWRCVCVFLRIRMHPCCCCRSSLATHGSCQSGRRNQSSSLPGYHSSTCHLLNLSHIL